MAKQSAGILLYRKIHKSIEVLLVYPGGPYFSGKDAGNWTVPKGEFIEEEEAPLAAAIREMEEETGFRPEGPFTALSPIKQKSGKIVHCWAQESDLDVSTILSNTFELEWPPKSGKRKTFPEVEKAAWFPLEAAKKKINERQIPLLEELQQIIQG
ncbi:NUDIX domain-containing protein [Paraflavitalea soli]|uniref:NUDIX domain-containing protein n=1 Tax=Paraflavitalea soli TaxID=2315862 RepID=A0A3B7MGY9_9BACT|nr:NUDIX domain-containing protein [Paraflavitalea soli]AXY72490.1 NUDIX domain-containing protein [Paraflavitalea soli]